MASNAGLVLLTDGRSSVGLHPPLPYPDGSGFHHQVDLIAPPFHGAIEASSYGSLRVLRPFREQLIKLYDALEGEARLPETYDNLQLRLRGDGRGHIAIEVAARGERIGDCLTFSFAIDQTQLLAIIDGIERFLKNATET